MTFDPKVLNLDADYTAPAESFAAVTPNDTTPLPFTPRAFYIGGDGNVVLQSVQTQANVTFTGVKQGTILPVRANIVRATGTTATGIVALY